jgi:hypothetical protein
VARFDRTIPPGGEGKITLELKTKGYQGKVNKTARVETNDPRQPQIMIGLFGTVWVAVEMSPQYGHIQGVVGEKIENIVSLEAKKEEPLVLELTSVSIPDKVDVELKQVEKGRKYEVRIQNKVKGVANYNGEIKLKTNYPEAPELVVRVTGNVRPTVEARPKELSFGRISQQQFDQVTKNKRPLTRPILVILNKGEDLKVTKVRLEKSLFKAATQGLQNNRMVQVVVEADFGKLKKGMNEDILEITTNQKGHEVLKVPVRFELL